LLQQKNMPDNFGLLFDTIFFERLARYQIITVSAKRMPRHWQENAFLMLPHMCHFVNEKALQIEVGVCEIFMKQPTAWMEPEIAVWCHGHSFGLQRPPFSVEDLHLFIVYFNTKNRPAQVYFRFGQRTRAHLFDAVRGFWCGGGADFANHCIIFDPGIIGKNEGHCQFALGN